MPTIADEIYGLLLALEEAIPDVLEHEVADAVKEAISDQTYPNVYNAYDPKFWSRRGKSGGIADTRNMVAIVSGNELIVRSEVPLQNLFGKSGKGNGNLANIVETGAGYNMPFPRPYHEDAENAIRDKVERIMQEALTSALHSRGY